MRAKDIEVGASYLTKQWGVVQVTEIRPKIKSKSRAPQARYVCENDVWGELNPLTSRELLKPAKGRSKMDTVAYVVECYSCGKEFAMDEEQEEKWQCPECLAKPKLQFHYSLEHANKVLDLVRAALEQEAPEDWSGTIECWSNCREQGYALSADSRDFNDFAYERPKLVLAQTRNGDSVVVAAGTTGDFCGQSNQPKEEVWEIKGNGHGRKKGLRGRGLHYFSSDLDAARFIVDHLLGKE